MVNVKRFFMSLSTNKAEEVARELLSPEVTYTVPGRSSVSGVFHGPDEVQRHLGTIFGMSNCTYDVLKWDDWMLGKTTFPCFSPCTSRGTGPCSRGT